MILTWVLIIIVVLIGLGIAGYCVWKIKEEKTATYIVGLITTLIITIVMSVAIGWWLYNTESGKRAIKDTQSNTKGGIERTVTVYDFEGDVIQKYTGKFDVDYNSKRIKFDDEKGKRHVIYYTTGTITVDEN